MDKYALYPSIVKPKACNSPIELHLHVNRLSENYACVSSTLSTAEAWLPVVGIRWSRHPHDPYAEWVYATIGTSLAEVYAPLLGGRGS